ncbi:hypothetical protein CPB86DRAFT_800596 [Serendipita vermifera]|nr:hypothetical protein CPB86DRAFT_800596 [Serendipita vermifera]
MRITLLFAPLSVIGLVTAHGIIKVPKTRVIGSAMLAACGQRPYDTLKSDPYGPIETAADRLGADSTSDCDLYFCKGYKWSDNGNFYYNYSIGEVVNMQTDIVAHHPGYCNVSIMDTSTKKPISRLITWDPWGIYPWPAEESNFNVTIPDLPAVRDRCTTPGNCVLQWFWYSPRGTTYNGNNQTYESVFQMRRLCGQGYSGFNDLDFPHDIIKLKLHYENQ